MHGCSAALKCCYSNSLGVIVHAYVAWKKISTQGQVELLGGVLQYPETGRSLRLALYRDGNKVSIVYMRRNDERDTC